MYRELNRECLPLAYQETYQRGSISWEILLFYECDSFYVIMLSKILVDVPNYAQIISGIDKNLIYFNFKKNRNVI